MTRAGEPGLSVCCSGNTPFSHCCGFPALVDQAGTVALCENCGGLIAFGPSEAVPDGLDEWAKGEDAARVPGWRQR